MGEPWRPSALNEATTARYLACEAGGGHADSGEAVDRRTSGSGMLPVCGTCGVPFRPPAADQPGKFRRRHQAEQERAERAARRRTAAAKPVRARAPRVPAARRPCTTPGCENPRWTLRTGLTLTKCHEHEGAARREANRRLRARRREEAAGSPWGVPLCSRCGLFPRKPKFSWCIACSRQGLRETRARKAGATAA